MILYRRLPLLAKILIPIVALTVVIGALGVLFVTRDLSRRAQLDLNDQLARRIVEARSFLHEQELNVLDAANYAANLQGMATAVQQRDAARMSRLLESVLALRRGTAIAVIADSDGTGLVERRPSVEGRPTADSGGRWGEHPFVVEALESATGERAAGAIAGIDEPMIAVAAPVCAGEVACEPVGVAIVGVPASSLLDGEIGIGTGVSLFDSRGALLAARGEAVPAPSSFGQAVVRRTFDQGRVSAIYAPFSLRGRPSGTIAISAPTDPAFAAARDAARRLAWILIAAIAGTIVIASLLFRAITRQVRTLVETHRRLGGGELTARAAVRSGDEIGELAAGVNTMADQLQAAVETLELRVEQRTEEIRRLMKERSQFFASLSHEFRTPLAVIIAQSERLEDAKTRPNGQRTRDISATIRQSAGQALDVVNDVLEFARTDSLHIELRCETVDVAALLRDVRHTVEALGAGGGISVVLEEPDGPVVAEADLGRVREVVLNLADNAVKYSRAGGEVRLAAVARDGMIEIRVRDSGPGIPAEATSRIFEPFYRVPGLEPGHGRRSTGLGLALSRRLVEAHGGSIGFENHPEGGATFAFTLPAPA